MSTVSHSPSSASPHPAPGAPTWGPEQRRQTLWITAGALAVFAALRLIPTGTNLSHMDFRVDPKAGTAIEFCDPSNPQFIPVVAAKSPVTMSAATDGPPRAGAAVTVTLTLATGSGKVIAPEDLLVTHTRRLHVLAIDPTLQDYQHLHPVPGRMPGQWTFSFTPQRAGTYRLFGDFTPAATGRGLYASVDLEVAGAAGAAPAAGAAATEGEVRRGDFVYRLAVRPKPARAGQPVDLAFAITAAAGGAVPLEPVMGAYAHLVAFDAARSGFAHLHPMEADPTRAPDAQRPVLTFKLTIPRAGTYTVWAQLIVAGREEFVPFRLDVAE
jgi:hypothetical protein